MPADQNPLQHRPLTAVEPVIIDSPAEDAVVVVGEGCQIDTSGRIHEDFPELSAVEARASVNGGSTKSQPCASGHAWSVGGVGGARWNPNGLAQTVSVNVYCYDTEDGTYVDIPGPARRFFAYEGHYDCVQYEVNAPLPGNGAPVSEVLPRYLKITMAAGTSVNLGALAGGVTALSAVYLAFDPLSSTPEQPVWRETGLPPGAGGWQLRVVQTNDGYTARLAIQMLSDTRVYPWLLFAGHKWDFDSKNRLEGIVATGSGKLRISLVAERS